MTHPAFVHSALYKWFIFPHVTKSLRLPKIIRMQDLCKLPIWYYLELKLQHGPIHPKLLLRFARIKYLV